MIIGNLWSVTDKDTDELTYKLIESIFDQYGQAKLHADVDLNALRD